MTFKCIDIIIIIIIPYGNCKVYWNLNEDDKKIIYVSYINENCNTFKTGLLDIRCLA